MSVQVTYNGVSPWGTYTPYVSKTTEPIFHGGRWAQLSQFTLDGTLVEANYSDHEAAINSIINTFASNFKVFSYPGFSGIAMVDSIDFPEQNFIGVIPYSISLRCYESDEDWDGGRAIFGMYEGVLSPVDEYSFQEEKDGCISITHKLSAKGINQFKSTTNPSSNVGPYSAGGIDATENDALANAMNFVKQRTVNLAGGSGLCPSLIHGAATAGICPYPVVLINVTENIDRLNATYSIEENYLSCPSYTLENQAGAAQYPIYSVAHVDPNLRGVGVGIFNRFTVDLQSGIGKDYIDVSVKSETKGGMLTSMADLRNFTPASYNLYRTGVASYQAAGFTGILNTTPLVENIEENPENKTIIVTATFDNNDMYDASNVIFDWKVSYAKDEISSISSISIEGELLARGPDVGARVDQINNWINTIGPAVPAGGAMGGNGGVANYLAILGQGEYIKFAGQWTLNPYPKSWSINKNEQKGTCSIRATFTDEDHIIGYANASWSTKAKAPIAYRKPHASATVNGYYNVQDFGINTRQKVDISVSLDGRSFGNHGLESGPINEGEVKTALVNMSNSLNAFFAGNAKRVIDSEGININSGDPWGGSSKFSISHIANPYIIL